MEWREERKGRSSTKTINFPLIGIIRSAVYGVLVDPNEPQWSYYQADDIATLSHNAVITSINPQCSGPVSPSLTIDPPGSSPTHYLVTANTRYRSDSASVNTNPGAGARANNNDT